MFELKNVTKFYNNNGVVTLGLHNINLKLNKGEIVAITGDSGSGKSTLLNVITGVDTYEEGEILYYGNETSYFNQNDMDHFRKNNVSFIFQKYNIIDSYTVLENVMIPLLMEGLNKHEAKIKATELINKVGLSKKLKNKGTQLSGGEKQRCVIARALATNSEILACDEPTGNLDSKTGEEIINLIKEVSKDRLVLIVTHNYKQVEDIVTRKIKLSDGEIVEDVTLKEVSETETKPLNLSSERIKKTTLNKFAMQNILSTPKKTILSLMIFLVISIITLIGSLLIVEASYNTSGSLSDNYSLASDERIIVYDKDHKPLDTTSITNLGYDVLPNAFYEETEVKFTSIENTQTSFKLITRPIKYKVKKGKDISKDGDYLIILPKNFDSYWIDDFNDNDLNITSKYSNNTKEKIGYVSGIATSSQVKKPYLYSYSKNPTNIINMGINDNTYLEYFLDNESFIINPKLGYDEKGVIEKTTLVIPKNLKDKITYKFTFSELYEVKYNNILINYSDDLTQTTPMFLLGKDYLKGTLTPTIENTYEASVYGENIKKLEKEIKDLGFSYTVPTHVKGTTRKVDLVILYMFMGLLILALFGLFFVSFAVMSRIYQSKTKDYGVLRALGILKTDLGYMVKVETITLGLLSSIISLILFGLVSLFIPKLKLIHNLSIVLILFYFLIIYLFAYFTARRFNSKLFKFSVSTKLKDGENVD